MYKYFTELVDFVGSKPKTFIDTKKYISTGALKTDFISEDDIEIVDYISRPSRADLVVNSGDILFAKMAYTDKRLLVNDVEASHIYSTGFFAVKPKDGILTAKCLYYLLSSETFKNQKDANSTGATQKAITIEGLKKIKLRVPEYNKQDRIGSVLENIERIIKYKQQQLSEYDQLIKSRFVEMFGDPAFNSLNLPLRRFDSICENLDSKRRPITATERVRGIYPYYGASGIVDYVDGYLFDEDILLISEDGANLLARSTPIAFSVKGKVWVNNHAHVVRFNEIATQKYVEYFFSMVDISEHILGSAQPKLNQSKLNSLLIPMPSLDNQRLFYGFINHLDKLKFVVQKSLDETQKLFDSLMQEYFG